jgi:hypothetical protein
MGGLGWGRLVMQRLMELRRAILLLQDRPSISFSRLYSTVIAADHSAGIEGENWDEIVVFACSAITLLRATTIVHHV